MTLYKFLLSPLIIHLDIILKMGVSYELKKL